VGRFGRGNCVTDIEFGLSFLYSQTLSSVVVIFWYTLVFDLPRYALPFAAVALSQRRQAAQSDPITQAHRKPFKVSVVLIGHNEADSIRACVRSLREQSFSDFEIVIVSDGSTDRMSKVACEIVGSGDATCVLSTDVRGGKSSGVNLACEIAKGDIIINVDCDCSFDRFAIEALMRAFDDPRVGAACGDIAPRNADATLMTQIQEIEYLQSISVGKRFSGSMDQVTCCSGAFGAFRREALAQVGGLDVGGGEDLDVTIRMRQAGWRIAFVPDALCYTDVPESVYAYIRQRLRWERDAFWLRFRKHRRLLNPFGTKFRPAEAFHQWDFALFSVASTVAFPIYLLWLATHFGPEAIPILISLQLALLLLDAGMLALANRITRRAAFGRNLPFLPAYSLFMSYVMRFVRLTAYVDEWFVSGSHRDNYVPAKVRLLRPW